MYSSVNIFKLELAYRLRVYKFKTSYNLKIVLSETYLGLIVARVVLKSYELPHVG